MKHHALKKEETKMNPKVKEIFDLAKATAQKAAKAAGKAAETAGRKTEEMVEIAKFKMQIFSLENDCDALFKDIGKSVYVTHTGDEIQPEEIEKRISELDEKYAQIAALRAKIELARPKRKCPACGRECDKDDAYCGGCGGALE